MEKNKIRRKKEVGNFRGRHIPTVKCLLGGYKLNSKHISEYTFLNFEEFVYNKKDSILVHDDLVEMVYNVVVACEVST